LTGREWQRDKVEPYPENLMDTEKTPGTICGVLREIWQASDQDDVKLLSRIGVSMAKKMASRLRYYYDKSNG
jgi:hypothetical protein